jgi:hypothetical protein
MAVSQAEKYAEMPRRATRARSSTIMAVFRF